MNLTDSHAHVDVSDFDADRDAMLDRARAAGVGTLPDGAPVLAGFLEDVPVGARLK